MFVTNLSFSALAYFFKDDIDAARELAIKGLCIYLNEDPKDLIQEYVVSGYSTDSISQAMFNKQYITTSKTMVSSNMHFFVFGSKTTLTKKKYTLNYFY